MDPVLARMFDLDRPLAVRMADRDLQEDFIKSASEIGLDLTKLADDEVDQLWRYHKGYRIIQADMMAKEAAWVKMGRSLAHTYVNQLISQGMKKLGQPLDPTGVPVTHLQGLLGDPALTPRLTANPQQVIDMVAAGLPEADAKAWATAQFGGQPMEGILHQKIEEAWKGTGAGAHMQKWQQGPPLTPMSRRALARQMQLHGLGAAPAVQPSGFWAKYGPSGLMKAITSGDWATALRKGLLPVGLGIGAMTLMKRKAEQDRERQLAMASMASAPGVAPMAGFPRLGPGAAV